MVVHEITASNTKIFTSKAGKSYRVGQRGRVPAWVFEEGFLTQEAGAAKSQANKRAKRNDQNPPRIKARKANGASNGGAAPSLREVLTRAQKAHDQFVAAQESLEAARTAYQAALRDVPTL